MKRVNLLLKGLYYIKREDKSHDNKYEDAEPTQHRYSASTATSAGTGGRAKKIQKSKWQNTSCYIYDKAT